MHATEWILLKTLELLSGSVQLGNKLIIPPIKARVGFELRIQ